MTIRQATPKDAAGIARVHVESWRTTYPGIMPQEHLDALSVADRQQMWAETLRADGPTGTTVYVAETEGGEIVGFVAGGPEKAGDPAFRSEIYGLYLLQAYQGKGLGRRLVQTFARRMSQDGHRTLLIWVNVHNPRPTLLRGSGRRPRAHRQPRDQRRHLRRRRLRLGRGRVRAADSGENMRIQSPLSNLRDVLDQSKTIRP